MMDQQDRRPTAPFVLRAAQSRFRLVTAGILAATLATMPAAGQTSIRIDEPAAGKVGWLIRNYQPRTVPPINLANTSRLDALIKAGNLYLTAQDVVSLVLENNIDIEVQRYGPLLAREVLRRAQGGGLLRSVGQGVAAGPTSVSLAGVSVNTNGAPATSAGGVNSSVLTQLGPSIPSFDPSISGFTQFQHQTIPQSNTLLSGTQSLVIDSRTFQVSYSQATDFGLSGSASFSTQRQKVNSAFFSLNPYTNANLDVSLTQNLLNGFGRPVNTRNIRVQKNNLKVTDLQFKQQVTTTVSAALNLYWDLVGFSEDVKSRQQAVSTAQQLLDNNRRQVQIGTLAEIEVTRAQSQLYAAKQDLLIAQTNQLQQETILKNVISRSGVGTTDLANLHVVPLDRIVIPEKDDLKTVDQLVLQALESRIEIETDKINLESTKMNMAGVKSALKPSLQAFGQMTNNGLAGNATAFALAQGGVPVFAGGYGSALAQILRRNYPNYSAGFSLNIPLRNRAAQSDYATTMLEFRQSELQLQKQINQVRVDVQNAVIGLQQARVRYEAAVEARKLSEATFEGDKRKYDLGAATPYQVVQDQRDLAAAQSSEVQAMANYSHARIALDQAIGATLEVNHISLTEAMAGKVTAPVTAR
ncbi:MAG: TolC family protein [Acidobacteriia bacterium]|jgi:outer membrane protein|nr:TolC family protein [Terriglobia bacterium]